MDHVLQNNSYRRFWLREEIIINNIITFSYSELHKDYEYPGEKHDFWEFLYLDKGEVTILTDYNQFSLKQGDLVFYSPNEFHALNANNRNAPNILIVSFECHSTAMNHFVGKHFHLQAEEQQFISNLLREGSIAFETPIDEPRHRVGPKKPRFTRADPAPFGSEQLIKLNLEMLMISLIRRDSNFTFPYRRSLATNKNTDEQIVQDVMQYLSDRVMEQVTIEQIAQHFNIGLTPLRTLFKKESGVTIMDYFQMLKIERAKTLIRDKKYTFTEIADMLSFSSIHYFSRRFKQITDMTPTEYNRSLRR